MTSILYCKSDVIRLRKDQPSRDICRTGSVMVYSTKLPKVQSLDSG